MCRRNYIRIYTTEAETETEDQKLKLKLKQKYKRRDTFSFTGGSFQGHTYVWYTLSLLNFIEYTNAQDHPEETEDEDSRGGGGGGGSSWKTH